MLTIETPNILDELATQIPLLAWVTEPHHDTLSERYCLLLSRVDALRLTDPARALHIAVGAIRELAPAEHGKAYALIAELEDNLLV